MRLTYIRNGYRLEAIKTTILRVALGAFAVWLVPFIASRFISDWHWPPAAFLMVYCLFFALGMIFALIARRIDLWSYKAGVGIALATGFGLAWSNMVHVADSENPANLLYFSVIGVGLIGTLLSRLKPKGLSLTLFAMAATLALISVTLPSGAPPDLARNMAIGHAGATILFFLSGLLFRHASSQTA